MVQLLGPRKVKDRLAYRQLPSLPLPFPSLDCLLKGTDVSSKDREIIASNLDGAENFAKDHMRDLANKLGGFMDQISIGVNRLDSFLGFHLDLFSHCDGEVVDLMRDKASSLFNPSFRAAVKGAGGPSMDNPSGLLGGEAAVRSRLSEATKEDDLLKKTMQKPYKKSGYRGGRSGGRQKSRRD